jgi:hypothetical protein
MNLHLVGSIGLDSVEEVFSTVGPLLGRHLRRIPRSDDAYFVPLKDLQFRGELYLGVVHAADGVEGARKRMATASKYVPKFGIACECGIARARKPELVRRVLEIHADAAR